MKNILLILLLSIVLFSCKKETDSSPEPFPIEKTENWMQDLIKEFPSKTITLKDICMPRAHDAGMYEVNNCYAGNACNTQTQDQSMVNMLLSGVRVFDVRPTFHDGEFWTFHKTQCDGFGCDGVKLVSFLEETKSFLDTHNELVILEFSHFCNVDNPVLIDLIEDKLGNLIYKETTAFSEEFIDRPLSEILAESNTSGKVVLQMESVTQNKTLGYFDNSYIPIAGSYANKHVFEEMKTNQLAKLNAYDENSQSLFKLSWTLTMNTGLALNCFEDEAVSIQDITEEASAELANTVDEWIANGTIYKGKIPNIFSVDFANTMVTEQCILLSKLNIE